MDTVILLQLIFYDVETHADYVRSICQCQMIIAKRQNSSSSVTSHHLYSSVLFLTPKLLQHLNLVGLDAVKDHLVLPVLILCLQQHVWCV